LLKRCKKLRTPVGRLENFLKYGAIIAPIANPRNRLNHKPKEGIHGMIKISHIKEVGKYRIRIALIAALVGVMIGCLLPFWTGRAILASEIDGKIQHCFIEQ